MTYVAIFLVLLLCVLSVRRRMHIKTMSALEVSESPEEAAKPKSSPLADSLTELVALAGGIYIGVTALTSFLKIQLPQNAAIMGISIDPIALVSLVLAIVQPYFVRLRNR